MNPHVTFDDCPSLDYLLVAGGQGTRTEIGNERLLEFIRSRAGTCEAVLSVCTGAFLLHAAGLLQGRQATTHWASLKRLRDLGDVRVVEECFVRDGHIWTAGGISAGMDMMLALIADASGSAAAGWVQLAAEYYPAGTRYGHTDDLEPHLPAYARSPGG